MQTILLARSVQPKPVTPASGPWRRRICASRSPAAISNAGRRAGLRHRSYRRCARRQSRHRDTGGGARTLGRLLITASEAASLHLERLRTRAEGFRSRDTRPADRRRHAAGFAGDQGAEVSAVVPAGSAQAFSEVDAILAPATPCPAPLIGQQTVHARRFRIAGARQSRHLHAADLLHRPSGRRCAGAAVALADRRADHLRAVA